MKFDFSKLRGLIIERYHNVTEFSAISGISVSALSRKLNGDTPFSASEIYKMAEILEIPEEEMGLYFFTRGVQ